jgi:hypothetical protein
LIVTGGPPHASGDAFSLSAFRFPLLAFGSGLWEMKAAGDAGDAEVVFNFFASFALLSDLRG